MQTHCPNGNCLNRKNSGQAKAIFFHRNIRLWGKKSPHFYRHRADSANHFVFEFIPYFARTSVLCSPFHIPYRGLVKKYVKLPPEWLCNPRAAVYSDANINLFCFKRLSANIALQFFFRIYYISKSSNVLIPSKRNAKDATLRGRKFSNFI